MLKCSKFFDKVILKRLNSKYTSQFDEKLEEAKTTQLSSDKQVYLKDLTKTNLLIQLKMKDCTHIIGHLKQMLSDHAFL